MVPIVVGFRGAARVLLRTAVVFIAVAVDIVAWDGALTTRSGAVYPTWLPPAAMILVGVLLFWRFHAPVFCAAASGLLSCTAVVLVPGWQPFAGLLVAVHAVASVRPARISVPVTLACGVPLGLQAVDSANSSPTGPWIAAFAVFALFQVIVAASAFGFGRWTFLAAQRSAEATARALRADRLRLARELHDTIASNLTAMMIHATSAATRLGPEHLDVSRALTTIGLAGNRAMDEMARLLGVLRAVDSSELADSQSSSEDIGLDGVTALVAEFTRERGLNIVVTTSGNARPLDATPSRALFRVIREGLVNAAKYGDPAAACLVRVAYGVSDVSVEIENQCAATAAAPLPAPRLSFGWGLTGLRETIELAGGTFHARPVGNAFLVYASIPIRPKLEPGMQENLLTERGRVRA